MVWRLVAQKKYNFYWESFFYCSPTKLTPAVRTPRVSIENHFFSLTGVWLWALGSGGPGERFDLSLSVLAGLGGEQWAEEVGGLVRWVRGLFSGAVSYTHLTLPTN